MFKLPVCPHCHTVYRYGDVRQVMNKKQYECYNCKKTMIISKKGYWKIIVAALLLSSLSTFVIMSIFENATVIAPYIATVIWIIAAFFARPFFIKFISNEQKKR